MSEGRATGLEFPGYHVPGGPVFDRATLTAMGDAGGRQITDLAMGFGSSLLGHGVGLRAATATVVGARDVAAPGLGDLYTHELRERASRALCETAATCWGGVSGAEELRSLVLLSGSDAVETALKTALLATGRTNIVAFDGAYHGTFGMALAATSRPEFREPFAAQHGGTVRFGAWNEVPTLDERVACVIVEPIQGRAGVRVPDAAFLHGLRAECDRVGALLVLDEVLTGSWRCSDLLHGGAARPDIVALGKALGSGVPASAVVARRTIAERAWGGDGGEPIHTSTNVGHPLMCAAILHTVETCSRESFRHAHANESTAWSELVHELGAELACDVRGHGLLWALDTGAAGAGYDLAQQLLRGGVLVVPSGSDASSITLLPAVANGEDARRSLRPAAYTKNLTDPYQEDQ